MSEKLFTVLWYHSNVVLEDQGLKFVRVCCVGSPMYFAAVHVEKIPDSAL